MSRAWHGLGGDPTPGDAHEVHRLARELGRAGAELEVLTTEVARLVDVSAAWRGGAAGAFAQSVTPLPGRLRAAAEAFRATARQLSSWAFELEELQAEARALEREAVDALAELRRAAAGTVVASPLTGVTVVPGTGDGVAAAEHALRRVMERADDLRGRWRAAARPRVAAVRAATEAAPRLPLDLGELVWQHRVGISEVVDGCSVLSVPVGLLGPPGALAGLALSGVAMTGQVALTTYAGGSRADVAVGAVGLGLGVGSLGLKGAAPAASGMKAVLEVAGRRVDDAGLALGVHGIATTAQRRLVDGPVAPKHARAVTPPATVPAGTGSRPAPSPALRRLLVAPVGAPPGRSDR